MGQADLFFPCFVQEILRERSPNQSRYDKLRRSLTHLFLSLLSKEGKQEIMILGLKFVFLKHLCCQLNMWQNDSETKKNSKCKEIMIIWLKRNLYHKIWHGRTTLPKDTLNLSWLEGNRGKIPCTILLCAFCNSIFGWMERDGNKVNAKKRGG